MMNLLKKEKDGKLIYRNNMPPEELEWLGSCATCLNANSCTVTVREWNNAGGRCPRKEGENE